jgi:membrane-associated phospholipid phosphatase
VRSPLTTWSLLAFTAVPGRAYGQSSGTTYRADWADVAAVTVSGATALLPGMLKLPGSALSCAPCSTSGLPAIDRWAVGQSSSLAQTGSNVMLVGVGGLSAYLTMHDLTAPQARGNLAVLANSITWTSASTQWLKVLVRRKRPVLYTSGAVAAAAAPDNQRSFPSGHTSVAFSVASAYLVMGRREHLPHYTRNSILLFAGAAGVGALRVRSGSHFPTDVLGGAALGTGIGWLVAVLHPRTP